jgi:CBS domain-containing protein
MTKQVRTVKEDASLVEVAKIMSEINCGAVPVVTDNKVRGIVTDRDIVIRCVARGQDVSGIQARDCMTTDIISCGPDMDAHKAADLMAEKQIRRLPVLEGDALVGIVALGDLATVNIHVDEAGDALSSISFPSRAGAH